MRTAGRPVTALLALAAALALIGCSPTAGPLGTPSSPAPTGDASVAPPSGDATPGATGDASPTPASSAPASSPSSATASATPALATPTATPAPSGTTLVRAYFVLGQNGLVPVLRTIPATTAVASAAMRQLIAGPIADELGANPALQSAVPASTRLLGLAIKDGVATINLSSEFLTGYSPSAPDARYGQVVYTLTQFSTVNSVVFLFDGQAATGIGVQRGAYPQLLRAISVDHPAWGAGAGNPVLVSGVANVFEAAFRIQVKDAKGKVLADQPVMASCGTGCWGTFSASVAYTVTVAQWGTLRVFDLSAKDGAPVDVTEYPLWLTPAG